MSETDKENPAHIRLRLPRGLKDWIAAEADRHAASINSEVVRAMIAHRERVEDSRAKRAEKATA